VVPSEVVMPIEYYNSKKIRIFMLMFTGCATWIKFLL